ncbi:MAG: DUF3644 domain-containing protein [Candidatus Binatia bacterium]
MPKRGPGIRKESRLLLQKAGNSLLLAVEHFNRPWDRGRQEAVLIFLDHAFEMLLKASILHRGGRIRERRASQTIGFDACVRKALSDGEIKFLAEDQAITMQMINALRDAAQHHLLDTSEAQLYLHTQAGITLFSDVLKDVFNRSLAEEMPDRVLPVSTKLPKDLTVLMSDEVMAIRDLLKPGGRKKVEARSRARALAIMEGAVLGVRTQPRSGDLNRILNIISEGQSWNQVFPGIASLRLDSSGDGIPVQLRITKKEGVPIQLVPEGTPGAAVVAVRRVDELGYYTLGLNQVAEKVGLSPARTLALVRRLWIQHDKEFFKPIQIGKARFKRYSVKAVERIREELPKVDLEAVWRDYRPGAKKNPQKAN